MNVVQDQPSQGHSEPRYATLVAGFDGSERALDGLAFAQMLADATGAELLVAAVVPHEFPYAPGTSQREDAMRQQAEDMLGRTVPDRQGVVTQVVGARSVAQGLHELAESARADALVVGSSHRGAVGRVLAGSIAEKLLHGAPCPVAVAPAGFAERSEPRLKVIAVGFDGSDESWHALRHAESLARAAGATLRLLSVHEQELIFGIDAVPAGYDPEEIASEVRAGLERDLQRAADSVAPGVEVQRFVLEGSPHAALIAAAENGVDLLVVGSRQYGPVRRVLLGGVSSALVRSSPAGVLVVPRSGEGE